MRQRALDTRRLRGYCYDMKTVGIKLLKNNLSRYLRAVRSGETVSVTDRDEVIAEIHRPATSIPGKISRWEVWSNAQERTGKLRRAKTGGPSLRAAWELPAPSRPLDLPALLDQTRADRS
jgi:antitoxin (DNA-binding transcriptional repressor) of toxin-antitoxin stability system